jgi:hypothetical protein
MEGLLESCKRPDLILGSALRYRAFIWDADWEGPILPPATGNTLLTTIRVLSQFREICVGQLAKESCVALPIRLLPTFSVEAYYDGEKEDGKKRRR